MEDNTKYSSFEPDELVTPEEPEVSDNSETPEIDELTELTERTEITEDAEAQEAADAQAVSKQQAALKDAELPEENEDLKEQEEPLEQVETVIHEEPEAWEETKNPEEPERPEKAAPPAVSCHPVISQPPAAPQTPIKPVYPENTCNPFPNVPGVDPSNPATIPQFVDQLPIPEVARPTRQYTTSGEEIFYHINMRQAKHRFHKSFPATTIWGYNGLYPGPTLEVQKDVPVKVKWVNSLPDKHLLPLDHTLHGTMDTPDVRTVVHLHGANVAADSDGHPEAWYTRDNKYTGAKYTRDVYEYTNHQAGCTMWYHDHAIGITRLNVYSGLAGFYLIRDFLEKRLNLPEGPYEIPLLIQDKSFNADGSLFYPDNATPPVPNPIPSTPSFFFGNTIVVNGKVWPYLEVEPRKYRFRILNGSNLRGYDLKFSNGALFHQIGTDLGYLHHTVEIDSFSMEPGERMDVIVDFSDYKGQEILLQNAAPGPPAPGMDVIMKFIVKKHLSAPDTSSIPMELMPSHKMDPALATKERTMHLDEVTDEYGRVVHLLNYKSWGDPATEKPKLDTMEIWHIVNHFNFPHPVHLHLVHFKILGRKPFSEEDLDENGNYKLDLASLTPPLKYEDGPKDVVRTEPGQVTSILMHFKEHTGDYVWHCHILEHEDYDMMRPLVVEP